MLICSRASYHDLSYDHRYAYLDNPEGIDDPRPVIVLLDAKAVLQRMEDEPERFPLQRRRLRELAQIGREGRIELPLALWWDGRFEIGDGRHRSAWLAEAGFAAIPFVTAEHMAEDLLYGLGAPADGANDYDFSQFGKLPLLDRSSI